MTSRTRGSAAAANQAVPESAGSKSFTRKLNALYRRTWNHMHAASVAAGKDDRPQVRAELAAAEAALHQYLSRS